MLPQSRTAVRLLASLRPAPRRRPRPARLALQTPSLLRASSSSSTAEAVAAAAAAAPAAARLPRTVASLLADPSAPGPEPTSATVCGLVRSVRRMKNVSFAHIADGTTTVPVQVVLTKPQAEALTTGTSVQITGQWKPSRNGVHQARELVADQVQVLGKCDPETYPLQKKFQTAEFLRTLPHLRARIPRYSLLLQLRSALTSSLTRFFDAAEFVQCYPPLLTSSDCEGAGEVFTVSANSANNAANSAANSANTNHRTHDTPVSASAALFFKTPKYLTVSTQLHLEALAAALPRVWTLSPSFRAEKSDTNRHLSEFYMLEAEVSFINHLDPLLLLIEDMIRHLVSDLVQSRVGSEIIASGTPELEARWRRLSGPDSWARISYTAAVDLLQTAVAQGRAKFQFDPEWGAGLATEHEKYLAAAYDGPVFVTDYPAALKPFYMLPSKIAERAGPTVACFDLLLPEVGELIGGSLREHRYDALLQNMESHNLVIDDTPEKAGLGWYAELRRWGTQPHGGFGMGVDRLLCFLSGTENVREVTAFPRWAGRCDC